MQNPSRQSEYYTRQPVRPSHMESKEVVRLNQLQSGLRNKFRTILFQCFSVSVIQYFKYMQMYMFIKICIFNIDISRDEFSRLQFTPLDIGTHLCTVSSPLWRVVLKINIFERFSMAEDLSLILPTSFRIIGT